MRTGVLGSGESCDALAPWESVSCDCLASSDAPCPRDEGQSRDSLAHDGALVVGRVVSPGRGPVTRQLGRRQGPSPATRRVPGTGPPSPETASQDGALSGDPRCPRDPRWSGEGGCHSLMYLLGPCQGSWAACLLDSKLNLVSLSEGVR